MNNAPTINDIAAVLGISRTTVSKAFAGQGRIADETRRRVHEVALELGYSPNAHAQHLSGGVASNVIGLFSTSLDNVAWQTMSVLHNVLTAEGYEAPLYTQGHVMADAPLWLQQKRSSSREEHARHLLVQLCRQRPAGIICSGFGLPESATDELKRYQQSGGTVVGYHTEFGVDCDKVLFDSKANTHLAAQHLLEAGHRKLGLCTYMVEGKNSLRLQGFQSALSEYGVALQKEWLFPAGNNEEGGAQLAHRFLEMKQRPTALCIVNDLQAAAFTHQVMRAGLKIPDDVSVVALDGLPASLYGMVQITTVKQPWEEMVHNAALFMMERLQKREQGEARRVTFVGEVFARDSVRQL
jgi:DNA-binding LacI/PurR family transcriptional regulator